MESTDEAANPRSWPPSRILLLVTRVPALALVVTLAVALVGWYPPSLTPIEIPTAPSA